MIEQPPSPSEADSPTSAERTHTPIPVVAFPDRFVQRLVVQVIEPSSAHRPWLDGARESTGQQPSDELAAVLASYSAAERAVLPFQKAARVDHCGHEKLPLPLREAEAGQGAHTALRDAVARGVARIRAAGAQKGMLFSANGFQRGAIQYAQSHGIALIRILDGALTYETKSWPPVRRAPPPWMNIPPFVGQLISASDDGDEDRVSISFVERGRLDAQSRFLRSPDQRF